MSRDKQIEEMVKHCHFYEDGNCILCEELWVECDAKCDMCEFAKQLYNAGYRKASEVAREIFEEIEKDGKYAISFVENHKSYSEEVRQAKLECYKDIQNYIAELKKKYESEGEG